MANEQMITIRGRLVADPELRFTPSGSAVANMTIAANASKFDKNTNEFKDKEAIFWRCAAWKEMAENTAETLTKGMAVIALVELESRSFEDKEGNKRTVTEGRIEAIGPDLRWASAKVTRASKGGNGGAQQYQKPAGQNQGNGGGWNAPAADPWGQPAANPASNGGWGNPSGQQAEPPF